MDLKTLLIILLLAAVGVLGYLYYDSQQTQVRIDVPGFKLEAK
jgi:predicted negative regulator of RcsB-dependent stress response